MQLPVLRKGRTKFCYVRCPKTVTPFGKIRGRKGEREGEGGWQIRGGQKDDLFPYRKPH